MLSIQNIFLSILLCLLFTGCVTQEQAPKPLNSAAITAKILDKNPNSAAFHDYLIKQGYTRTQLPLTHWGLDELTLCALFYHTKLDLAKEQLSLANLYVETAGIKQKPSINAEIAHSNLRNDDIKPWSYGLSIDIPIATNNKLAIKVEKAQQYAEAAKMDVAQTAWQLRHQIAADLTAYHQNQAETALLTETLAAQSSITSMLEKRVAAGVASRTELSTVSLLALQSEHALSEKQAQFKQIKAKLAADVGLSHEKFDTVNIKPLDLDDVLTNQAKALNAPSTEKTLQADALLNRIDIRRSLAEYAAAEAEIRLQVAKQTPDITLSPGILFDFGDTVWSLGFSSLLNSLHKNTALINQATQLREIQGKQFEHLQATTIAELNQSHVRYLAAQQTLQQAEALVAKQLSQMQTMQKQFDAGLIGKVALKKFALNSIVARQQMLASKFKLLIIANDIENVMQKPLYTSFNMPELSHE